MTGYSRSGVPVDGRQPDRATATTIAQMGFTQSKKLRIARPLNSPLKIVATTLQVVQENSTLMPINREACLFCTTPLRRVMPRHTLALTCGSATRSALATQHSSGKHQRTSPLRVTERAENTSVQFTFRRRRFELRDLGGLRRLAVEGQHIAFRRNDNAVAVDHIAGEDHLGQRILHMALDHPLQRPRAVGGIPTL